jgi:hypothetical protein
VALALGGLALIVAAGWRGPSSPSASGGRSLTLIVAARALEAGAPVGAPDLSEVSAPASDALAGLAHSPADLVGRRLAVAVPAGTPLSSVVVAPAPPSTPGHRLVRLPLDGAVVPPDLSAGVVVDAVAAVAASADGGRVVTVATGRVVAVAAGTSTVVTLDTDVTGAARLVWAQAFAKSVHLLVRPSSGDEAAPPDVSGVGR